MKRHFFALLLLLPISSCDLLKQVMDTQRPLSNMEVVSGLREALVIGTDSAVSNLNRQDGFFRDRAVKILLPPEINEAITALQRTGAGRTLYNNSVKSIEEDLILSLNRAAEDASSKAKPIFVNTIRNISIGDGFAILNGPNDAATSYLRENTYNDLVNAFEPDIQSALSKPLVLNSSPNQIYELFVSTYEQARRADVINALRLSPINEPNLSRFVTSRALDGVFVKVAREESHIRNNPRARVTELLRRVFGENS